MKKRCNFLGIVAMSMKLNKLGRNDTCHCGSREKYKRCCLSSDASRPQDVQRTDKIVQLKSAERLRNHVKNNIGTDSIVLQGELDGIKMSGVIIDLADFLLKIAHTKSRIEAAIAITCTAWNIAVVGIEKSHKFLDAYFNKIDDPVHQQDTLDIMSALIKKKLAYYPDLNRIILDYELVDTRNNLHLNVVSTVPEESIAKLKKEQVTQLLGSHHYQGLLESAEQ